MSFRILHVDDREAWRDTVKMVLESDFFGKVVSFSSLSEARSIAQRERFDYFVIDGNISGENGGAWAVELQRDGEKVVMVSSEAPDGIAFIPKGKFSKEALHEAFRELCGVRPHQRLREAVEHRLRSGMSKSDIRREIGASWEDMNAIHYFIHAPADAE